MMQIERTEQDIISNAPIVLYDGPLGKLETRLLSMEKFNQWQPKQDAVTAISYDVDTASTIINENVQPIALARVAFRRADIQLSAKPGSPELKETKEKAEAALLALGTESAAAQKQYNELLQKHNDAMLDAIFEYVSMKEDDRARWKEALSYEAVVLIYRRLRTFADPLLQLQRASAQNLLARAEGA